MPNIIEAAVTTQSIIKEKQGSLSVLQHPIFLSDKMSEKYFNSSTYIKQKDFNKELISEVYEKWKSGIPKYKLCVEYRISQPTLNKYIKIYGLVK